MSSKLRIVGLMCCLFHITLFAQNYDSFNLETFFGSDHDWKEAQYRIQKKLDSLEDSPITQIKTDHDLHEILKLGRTLRSTASRLVIYSILRSGANLNDTIASEIYQVGTALDSRVEALLSPLERAIMHLPKDSLNSWTSKPEFLPYLRRLNRIQKAKGYTLDGDAATLMKRIKGFPRTSVDVFWSLHGEAIDWPKRYVNGDTLVFNQQAYVNLSNLKDLSIRDEGIEHMFGELKKFENVFGLLYYKRIQGDYLLAKSEGFSSGMEAEWYKRDHIPKEGLENMIAAIRGNKEIIQDYVAAKADLLDRKINYSDLFKIIDIKGQDYTFSSSLDMVRKVAKAYDATFHEKILSVMEQPWSNIAHSDTKENTYSIYPPVTGNPYFIFNYYPTHKHARALMGGFTLMSIWSGLPKESIPENGDDPAVYANGIIFLGDLMYDEFLTRSLGADKVAQKQALINALDFYWYYALRWMIFSELDHLLEQKIISGEFLNGAQISKIYHGLLSQYFGDKIEIPEYFGMEWLLTHILFMSYEHQYWPASMAFATYLLESEMDRSKIVSDVFFKAPTNLEHDRSYEMLKEYNIDMTSPEVYNSIFYRMKRILDKIKSLEQSIITEEQYIILRSEKLNNEIDWVLGGLGAAHSLYLSIHVFLGRKKNPNNIWLGLLLFSLCIRILKSLLWLGYEHIPDWVLNLGFLAHSVTGPLLLIYIMGFVFGIQWRTWKILHFIPSILLLLFAKTLSLDTFWYRGGYTLLLVQQIVYSLGSLILLIKGYMGRDSLATPLSRKDWIWIMVVVMGVMFIQMTYFLNYILGWTPYILGPLVFPVFIYFLSFFGLRNPELFQRRFRDKKYANIQLSKKQMNTFVGSLVSHMEKERPYLKSDCTLGGVASDLHMPPYLLSYVINNEFGQNFPDYINSYRIDEAKRLLADASREKFKISSIAYDCGFNTLSAFNTWFKKIVGSTPSMYRKQLKDS